jgi:hypothetical protein
MEQAQQRYMDQQHLIAAQMAPRQDEQPAQPQQQSQPTPEQIIAQFPPRAQTFFQAHPQYLTHPRWHAKLMAAHYDTVDELGSEEMTDQYLDMIEARLGVHSPAPAVNGHDHAVNRRPIGTPIGIQKGPPGSSL